MRFSLRDAVIGIVLLAIAVAIGASVFVGAVSRAGNERSASASLKTITTAEADFRSNDRDGNRVNDFWTGDVYGLYGLVPIDSGTELPASTTTTASVIKLIEPSVAGADAAPCLQEYAHVRVDASIERGGSKDGYLFRAFLREAGVSLRSDTDGSGFYGAVHDMSRFAFAWFPEKAGRRLFVVNADNTIWKREVPGGYEVRYTPMTDTAGGSAMRAPGLPWLESWDYPADPPAVGCEKMD